MALCDQASVIWCISLAGLLPEAPDETKGPKVRTSNLITRVGGRIASEMKKRELRSVARGRPDFRADWLFSDVQRQLSSENDRYDYFLWFFHNKLDEEFVDHRRYFDRRNNWCGEDAFHAMWFKLLDEYRPSAGLEIGVHRGQTISYWQLVANSLGWNLDVWGLTPLNGAGDSVSWYGNEFDYRQDIDTNFRHFDLVAPKLFVGFSESEEAADFVQGHEWDLIYVDGSHDYEVVASDVALARSSLRKGGILVMDDASVGSSYTPYRFSFAGHEEPSRVASDRRLMEGFMEIGTCGHNRVFERYDAG